MWNHKYEMISETITLLGLNKVKEFQILLLVEERNNCVIQIIVENTRV